MSMKKVREEEPEVPSADRSLHHGNPSFLPRHPVQSAPPGLVPPVQTHTVREILKMRRNILMTAESQRGRKTVTDRDEDNGQPETERRLINEAISADAG